MRKSIQERVTLVKDELQFNLKLLDLCEKMIQNPELFKVVQKAVRTKIKEDVGHEHS